MAIGNTQINPEMSNAVLRNYDKIKFRQKLSWKQYKMPYHYYIVKLNNDKDINNSIPFDVFTFQPDYIRLLVDANHSITRLSESDNYTTWVSSIKVIYEDCEWMACIREPVTFTKW